MGASRRFRTGALLPALAAGGLVRLWYFLDLYRQPFFGHPIVDAMTYHRLALTILEGGGQGGAFFRPPLYPYLLSGIYLVTGHSQVAVVWTQFVLGLAAIIPAFLLAERWFGKTAATLTAWVLALYPLRIFFEGELLAVSLAGFLFAWGVWFLWSGAEGGSLRRLFWSGLILGCGGLARPNLLLILPFLVLGTCLANRTARRVGWRGLAVWTGGVLLAVAPATLHNWVAEKRWVPLAANGGINFYLGNAPGATGRTPLPPGLAWQYVIQEPLREGKFTLAEQDAYWWRRSRDEVLAAPGRWLGLLGRKGTLFWNARESSNNKVLGFFTSVSFPVRHYRGWFGLLACLGVLGLFRCRRRPGAVFLTWLLLGATLSVALFFVTARYRLPVVPFLVIPAAACVAECARLWRERDRKGLAGTVLPGAVLAVLIFQPGVEKKETEIDPHFQMGQVFLSRGDHDKSLEYLLRARAARPDNPDVYNSLGAAYFGLRDLREAEASYLEALRYGEFSEVYYNLGVIYEALGEGGYLRAAEAYRRALEINPLEAKAEANLAYLEGLPPAGLPETPRH